MPSARGMSATGLLMEKHLPFEILPQPDNCTCGPTCLHAVYRFHGEDVSLDTVISEVEMLEEGGTIAVLLGIHALRKGYKATIYSCNLEVFDPTWFSRKNVDLADRLQQQLKHKRSNGKLRAATAGYLEYLKLGGKIKMDDLRPSLIRKYLQQETPILTGLSSTFLYREARELPDTTPDDLAGKPQGHFVVLYGYRREGREVLVADPYTPNNLASDHYYSVGIERVISSIHLGILTYDANLLILEQVD